MHSKSLTNVLQTTLFIFMKNKLIRPAFFLFIYILFYFLVFKRVPYNKNLILSSDDDKKSQLLLVIFLRVFMKYLCFILSILLVFYQSLFQPTI